MATLLKNLKDEELLYIYRTKLNTEAIAILFTRYYHLVYGVCVKYLKQSDLAKDAAMQIFEKLISDLQRHNIQTFKPWLYQVAKNYCFMQLRSAKPAHADIEKISSNDMEFEENTHLLLEKEELLDKMELAMDELPTEQKKCIELFFLHKKTYGEIMNSTGFSFMQVKSYLQNGKRNLKLKINATEYNNG